MIPQDVLHSVPTQLILGLVRDLTVGQRSAETVESLTTFLHNKIFSRLAPLSLDIFLPHNSSELYLPPASAAKKDSPFNRVPFEIPGDHRLIRALSQDGIPHLLSNCNELPDFLTVTGNKTHILTPIQDEEQLKGLLYLGSGKASSFSPEFVSSLQTMAAVIGSRLKSMLTIRHLNDSLVTLEYSEQLKTALYEISEHAHSSANINDLYAKLHQAVGRLIYARNFYIALTKTNKDTNVIRYPYFADDNDQFLQNSSTRLDAERPCITGYVLKSKQPLLLTPSNFEKVCKENNIEFQGSKPYSWLGSPFYLEHVSGVVTVQSYEHIVYTEKDKELMAFVARHIGDALNRKGAADEMRKAKERAEEAEKKKSTFLANMSHEIRTPMNGILGLTDLVLASELTDQQRSHLGLVRTSARRLLNLINDILDFSKIEASKLNLTISPFSLREAIESALRLLAVNANEKSISLKVECDTNVPDMLMGDADKLSQIFINLAGNALKFTEKGCVTLKVEKEHDQNQQEDEAVLHFQIQDTGIGIPADKIDDVFKSFSQLSTTRDSNNRGTGLGLVIAAELTKMMGGKIDVESEPGVGTTFHFTLAFALSAPFTELPRPDQYTPSSIPASQNVQVPLQILLVEDEYINQTLAMAVLNREGWQVTVAENGEEALGILQKTNFDLVLMDIQMPKLNGYETTLAIRAKEKETGKHLPIIAMTAYAGQQDRNECFTVGMDGYISKPIRSNLLRLEIETILQKPTIAVQERPHTP